MDKKGHIPEEKKKKQSTKEQALDESATQGEKVNPKAEDKRDHHLPRDTA